MSESLLLSKIFPDKCTDPLCVFLAVVSIRDGMGGAGYDPQLFIALFFCFVECINHPRGHIIVRIAVDKKDRVSAFFDLFECGGFAEVPPVKPFTQL